MNPADPNELLGRLRAAVKAADGATYGARRFAEVFAQLDEQLTGGGLLPADWRPPFMQDAVHPQLDQRRARHRLESVLDRAIRDDDELDRATMGATRDSASPLRERLIRLLSWAIIQELEAEQRQVQAMLADLARRNTPVLPPELRPNDPPVGFRRGILRRPPT